MRHQHLDNLFNLVKKFHDNMPPEHKLFDRHVRTPKN